MPPEHGVSVINMARPDLSPPLSHNLLTSNDLCIYLRGGDARRKAMTTSKRCHPWVYRNRQLVDSMRRSRLDTERSLRDSGDVDTELADIDLEGVYSQWSMGVGPSLQRVLAKLNKQDRICLQDKS